MEQAAGIVLLLLAVAIVVQLMRAGPDGAREWIRAKFLGQTPGGAAAAKRHGASTAPAAASTGGSSVFGTYFGGVKDLALGGLNPVNVLGINPLQIGG